MFQISSRVGVLQGQALRAGRRHVHGGRLLQSDPRLRCPVKNLGEDQDETW
jgi:hypothetical protein